MKIKLPKKTSILCAGVLLSLSFLWSGCEDIMVAFGMQRTGTPTAPTTNDSWSFLPDYQPGESIYQNDPPPVIQQPIPLPETPKPRDLNPPSRPQHGYFTPNPDYKPKPPEAEPPTDTNPPAPPSTPEPDTPDTPADFDFLPPYNPPADLLGDSAKPEDNNPPALTGTNLISGFNEPHPKDIDYKKYGDSVTWDAMSGQRTIRNSQTGTSSRIYDRNDVHFGDPRGGTQVVTKNRDGVVIHEDFYNYMGDLVSNASVDPATGRRVVTLFRDEGPDQVEVYDKDGVLISSGPSLEGSKASTTDSETGETTTSTGNADRTRTVTIKDEDGNVISEETHGPTDSNVLITGSSTDPKTGITTHGTRHTDGTTNIERTDASGNVIDSYQLDASGERIAQAGAPASAGDSFAAFDALSGGPMGQLAAASTTPTGVFAPAPSVRDMNAPASGMGGNHHAAGNDY